MRIIKLAFLSFIFLFIVLTAITFLIPADIKLSKVVNISAPRDSIFYLLKNKDQWPRWHPTFKNTGAANTQRLQSIQTRVVAESDSLLQMQWQTGSTKPLNNIWQLHPMDAENNFTLQWMINFHSRWYPWEKLKSLFYENNYGKMMEQGLKNMEEAIRTSH